jgi:hypothetical protein
MTKVGEQHETKVQVVGKKRKANVEGEQQQQEVAKLPAPLLPSPYSQYAYPYPQPPIMPPSHQDLQYRDAANSPDPQPVIRRNKGGVAEPFPEKLHRMLDAAEKAGEDDVVSFFSHGRAFAIHKPRRFVENVMPRFFKQTKLTSFQRQLNLYGFKRLSQGPDNGGYYHAHFLKGRPGLCANMAREKLKGDNKFKRDPENEPNFYAMPPIKMNGETTTSSPMLLAPFPPPPTGSLHSSPGPSPSYASISAGIPATPYFAPYGYPPPLYGYPFVAALPMNPPPSASTGGVTSSPLAASYPPPFYGYPPYAGYPPYNYAPTPSMPSHPNLPKPSPVQTLTATTSTAGQQKYSPQQPKESKVETPPAKAAVNENERSASG